MTVSKQEFAERIKRELDERKRVKAQAEKDAKESHDAEALRVFNEYWSYAHARKQRGKAFTVRGFEC